MDRPRLARHAHRQPRRQGAPNDGRARQRLVQGGGALCQPAPAPRIYHPRCAIESGRGRRWTGRRRRGGARPAARRVDGKPTRRVRARQRPSPPHSCEPLGASGGGTPSTARESATRGAPSAAPPCTRSPSATSARTGSLSRGRSPAQTPARGRVRWELVRSLDRIAPEQDSSPTPSACARSRDLGGYFWFVTLTPRARSRRSRAGRGCARTRAATRAGRRRRPRGAGGSDRTCRL